VCKWLINPYTGKRLKDHTGKKYGKLTVLKPDFKAEWKFTGNRGIIWICKCECGKTISTLSTYLTRGTTKSCGCAKKKANWAGYEEIPKSIFTKYKNWSAKSRGIEFDLTIEQMWDIYIKQDKKCFYTGIPVTFGTSKNDSSATASLDRIDSKKGYFIDNVVWCHKHINNMKMNFDKDYFIKLCKQVTEWTG